MTIQRNFFLLPCLCISFIFPSLITGCNSQPPAAAKKEPALNAPNQDATLLIDTFYIEMDQEYRLQKRPELSHDHIDGVMIDLIIRGIFDPENRLQPVFLLDTQFTHQHGLEITAFGTPQNILYLCDPHLPITYYTFIDSVSSGTSAPVVLGIVRTAVLHS